MHLLVKAEPHFHARREDHHHKMDQSTTENSVQIKTEMGTGVRIEQTDLIHQDLQQDDPFCYHCYYRLMVLADRLGPYWTWLALQLGFTSADVERISSTYHPSHHPHWCLWEWVQRELWGATVDAVLVGLRAAGLHQIADDVETGALFQNDADDGSWGSGWKGQEAKGDGSSSDGDTDDDEDSGGAVRKAASLSSTAYGHYKADDSLSGDTDRDLSSSEPGVTLSNMEGGDISEDDGVSPNFDSSTIGQSMCPTGEDALAWDNCVKDFFKTDKDTTRAIQQSWPSSLLVKHLIRDRFFHPYLCEYWKQYQSFPGTLSTFVEFVTKVCTKQVCHKKGMHTDFETVYESQSLVLGKIAYNNEANNHQYLVGQSQLEWADIQQSSLGLLQPTFSAPDCSGSFRFVHDSIRQFLIAKWISQILKTTADHENQVRNFLSVVTSLSLSCYCVAHLLGQSQCHRKQLIQFVSSLLQSDKEPGEFNNLLHVVTTAVESKQLDVLAPVVEVLFPEKALDLRPLPEISFHGLHSLTLFMSKTPSITEITLPNIMTCKNLVKLYPIGKHGVAINISPPDEMRCLSYIPLFQTKYSNADVQMEQIDLMYQILYFTRCDRGLRVDDIQRCLLYCPSLRALSIQKTEIDTTAFSEIVPYLLFTPSLNTLAVRCNSTSLTKSVREKPKSDLRHDHVGGEEGRDLAKYPDSTRNMNEVINSCPGDGVFLLQLPSSGEIDPSYDEISDDTVPDLVKGLAACQNLKRMTVSWKKPSVRKDFLPPLPCLEEIDLSHNAITDEAVPGLAKFFGSCQNLKKVDLSYNNFSIREDFLPPLPFLEEIDLSHNAITDEAVPGLAKFFGSCQNLKKVDLSYNKLSIDFLPPLPNLEEIDLSHNSFCDNAAPGLAKCLGACRNLKRLNLSWNKLLNTIGDFILPLPSLEEINLSHNAISCKTTPGLAEGLRSCQNLNKLNLSHNKLCCRLNLLPFLPYLEEIDLSHNVINDDAMLGLAEVFGLCQKLKKVNLSCNKLSEMGYVLPSLPNLEEINISHNDIDYIAGPGLSIFLSSCKNLRKVDLGFNRLSDVVEMIEALINLPILTHVYIPGNIITDKTLPTIAAWLKASTSVEIVWLSSNRFSAEGVRDFIRTMRAKAYRLSDDLLYDGNKACEDEAMDSGGENVRGQEQHWKGLKKEKDLMIVKIGQLRVWIDHRGHMSRNAQQMSP
ncbi:uncharacterized protein LOC144862614 isoform X2 [Branchiostoma floridae x Branchiostoma japonicum]